MKKVITLIMLCFVAKTFAQISVKTEYISNSKFYDAVADTNTGDGSEMIYSVGALVPLSVQAPKEDDPYQRPTVWGVSLNGTFVQMDNHNFPIGKELPSQVMNLGATVLHLRPLASVFVRVNKSYVVNLQHITSYTHQFVYIGETEIPIGRAYEVIGKLTNEPIC